MCGPVFAQPRVRAVARLLACAALVLSSGCRRQAGAPAPSPTTTRRIITLAPSLTETVYALGLGERMVGTDDFSSWPPEVRNLPKLGGLFNPNLELLAALAPDLTIVLPSSRDVAQRAASLGSAVLVIRHESLADIEAGGRAIAERCGVADRGERFAREFRSQLAPVNLGRGQSVLLVVGRPAGKLGEIVAAGPGTYLDELLSLLGARNLFHDAPGRWPQVSLETIVARAPDWVVELSSEPLAEHERLARVAEWSALGGLPAVVGHRVLTISGDHALVPGPRVTRLYRELAAALRGAS
jgi:iron complex transport system substrate-binding protein